ncbi:3-oxoadipate enol-lactonase, partial [Escherichia coli]|nr:3-oxoadipate enol-lactonase [Escherichia coli]
MNLAYQLDGPDGAPVIVLSNSLGTTRAMWQPQIEALTAHFRVL